MQANPGGEDIKETALRSKWGRVTVTPDRGRSGEWDEWSVRYVVGERPIAPGGGIRVQLPKRWHQWGAGPSNAVRRLQTIDSGLPFYVSACSSRAEKGLKCSVQDEADTEYVKGLHKGLDGRRSRFSWIVQVKSDGDELSTGDWLEIVYGDRSDGGRGFTPPLHTGSAERVAVAVDHNGLGDFQLVPSAFLPWLHSEPGEPVELALTIPTSLVLGEEANVRAVALDQFQNGVPLPHVRLQLAIHDGEAELEQSSMQLGGEATLGSNHACFRPLKSGTLRVRATSLGGKLYAVSNPGSVTPTAPTKRVYWAELHSHSHFSADASGSGDDHFRYAKHVAAVDIYGNSDHGQYLTASDWETIQKMNSDHHIPRSFVTLVGYEASHSSPVGHHNIFFRSDGGPLLHELNSTLEDFWRLSVQGKVLTIPHGAGGIGGTETGPAQSWSDAGAPFRRSREVYSTVYNFDPLLELGATSTPLTSPATHRGSPSSGWMALERTGVIAASDNHASQPGKEGFGLTAVLATELTREEVFDSIAARRTYATTGSRIVIEFRVVGELMGGEVHPTPDVPICIEAHVVGTNTLHLVEVVRGDLGAKTWAVVHSQRFHPIQGPLECSIDWVDQDPVPNALYYLRLKQHNSVHGRPVMAWSSPVWVTCSPSSSDGNDRDNTQ